MRIAQMLDTLHMGGAQKMQIFLVQSLCPLGIEVTVIDIGESPNDSIVSELKNAGAKIVHIPFPRLFSPLSFIKLVRFLRREKFDLLHAYLTFSNIFGPIAGWLSGIPTIASLRSAGYKKTILPRPRIILENLSLKYIATRVTANGYSVGDYARMRLGDIPIDIIVNSVDPVPPLEPEDRSLMRSAMTGSDERLIILSVGRLVEQKDFHNLVNAFSLLHIKHPNVALVIAGGGKLEGELHLLVHDLALEKDVFLLGFRDDVHRLMGAADIYVNSSFLEGTPVSVLEAMSAGLPVVATDVGENPYLLNDNCGILVPKKDSVALSAALENLVDNTGRRFELGKSGQNRIIQKYSRDEWQSNLLRLYSSVTSSALKYMSRSAVTELARD